MDDDAMQAMCEAAAPCEHHDRFKPFEGTFRAVVKMWMGPGEPMISTGTMVNTLDLGGRFLRQEYKGDPHPGPFPNFEGKGYWGYNRTDGRYEGFWIDTGGTMMTTDQGQCDRSGRRWEMKGTMTCPGTGHAMTKRSVITLHDKNSHTMEMFHALAGEPEAKSMEITYTRA